jgi:cytochrome c-type biogenesis protein CcmH/NrfG
MERPFSFSVCCAPMFGRGAKIRRAVRKALDEGGPGAIEALAPELRGTAYGSLALAYYKDEQLDAARDALGRGLAVSPDDLDLHQLAATIAIEEGRTDDAIAAQTRVVAASPRDPDAASTLAELLLAAERVDEAVALLTPWRGKDPATDHRLAEALHVAGDGAGALALLEGVCAHYDAQLKQLSPADWHALKSRADEAERLRDEIFAELHGREATIDLAVKAGKLDARAGVNYRLMGARLAAASEPVTDVLELEDPDTTERRARRRLDAAPDDAAGLALLGIAQLRRGAAAAARKSFERACEADGSYFPAFLGLGAALDHEKHDLHRRAGRFAGPPRSPELAALLPDLPALTDAERRVVWASVQPLARLLPALAGAGVTMRILPLDVRATDVGLFDEVAGERHDEDHRTYDAISGLATHGGAIAKIEELLDVVTDGAWTFAHELAHLAFFHMPDDLAAPIHDLYERALEVGYAHTDYALSNPDEFFACSYADWLRLRHDLPGAPLADDAGLRDELTAYFDDLASP